MLKQKQGHTRVKKSEKGVPEGVAAGMCAEVLHFRHNDGVLGAVVGAVGPEPQHRSRQSRLQVQTWKTQQHTTSWNQRQVTQGPTHTDTQTQTHRHTDTQTHRHTHRHTHTHTDTE